MSRLIYRVCLIAVLLVVLAGGVYYYTTVYQKEAGPQKGTFVDRTRQDSLKAGIEYAGRITETGQPDTGRITETGQPDTGRITETGQPDTGRITETDQLDTGRLPEELRQRQVKSVMRTETYLAAENASAQAEKASGKAKEAFVYISTGKKISAQAVETGKEADSNGSTGHALFEN